jgi:hypothetical protein
MNQISHTQGIAARTAILGRRRLFGLDFPAHSSGTGVETAHGRSISAPLSPGLIAGLQVVQGRASRAAIMEHRLMARSTKPKSKSSRRSAHPAATEAAPVQSAPRPGGKLGLIVERLSAKTGVTTDELIDITGWQRPSVLGALSRLRSRGFALHLDVQPDRKAYRLDKTKG